MKSLIILAFVALAAAVPNPSQPNPYEIQSTGEYAWLDKYFGQGNDFQVPQYIAYQFHHFQQLKYTPDQVSQYLLQYGYPKYVVQYLAGQYEAGLDKSYFQAPYWMYQYYHQQIIPQEVQEYIRQHIHSYYHQFQKPHVFEQDYSVPVPLSQYMTYQLKFYTQKGLNFGQAHIAYQNVETALQNTQNIMQHFDKEDKIKYEYIYEQLQYALLHLQQAYQVYQPYMLKEQNVPYYVFQYYVQHIQRALVYFQNIYKYVHEEHAAAPEFLVSQIHNAYMAIQKVQQIYQSINWLDHYYEPSSNIERKPWSYDYDYPYSYISQEPQYWYRRHMNKDSYFNDQKYGYQYGSFDRYNHQQYGPYSSSYRSYPYVFSHYKPALKPSYQYYGRPYAY